MKRSARTKCTYEGPEIRGRRGARCEWVLTAYGMWWVPSLGRWSEYPAKGGPRGTASWYSRPLTTRTAALRAVAGVIALGRGGRLQRVTYKRGVLTLTDYEIPPK